MFRLQLIECFDCNLVAIEPMEATSEAYWLPVQRHIAPFHLRLLPFLIFLLRVMHQGLLRKAQLTDDLCYCRPDEEKHCHRYLLADFLIKLGDKIGVTVINEGERPLPLKEMSVVTRDKDYPLLVGQPQSLF